MALRRPCCFEMFMLFFLLFFAFQFPSFVCPQRLRNRACCVPCLSAGFCDFVRPEREREGGCRAALRLGSEAAPHSGCASGLDRVCVCVSVSRRLAGLLCGCVRISLAGRGTLCAVVLCCVRVRAGFSFFLSATVQRLLLTWYYFCTAVAVRQVSTF